MVSYSLPLLLLQSFNQATAEAVRRSVALDPSTPNYNAALILRATQTVQSQLQWIPATFQFQAGHINPTYTAGVLTVEINYPRLISRMSCRLLCCRALAPCPGYQRRCMPSRACNFDLR